MPNSKPTPGPWNLRPQDSYDGRSTHHFYRVFDDDLNAICCEEYGAHNDGGHANMLLIAAAPDLLAALKRVLLHIERDEAAHGRNFAAGNLARAAIAKARGEA